MALSLADLCRARDELTTAEGSTLDMVVLGSPHFSLAEFARLTPLLRGLRRQPEVSFLVTTSRGVRDLAGSAGHLAVLEEFGGRVTVDTCILATPMLPPSVKTIMTNSAKYAYYTPGLLGAQVAFGSLEDCVRSAVSGRIVRDDSGWRA